MTKTARIYAAAIVFSAVLLLSCSAQQSSPDLPDCDISQGPCAKTVMNRQVVLEISPRPVEAMKELSFRLTAEGCREREIFLDLTMPGMYMGENRVVLRRVRGAYEGKGIIPRCPSGRRLWQATIDIPGTGKVSYRFDVAR
ncbi:MAG: hypothetical protein WC291_01005 [Thermodesulfovibrionales bacterium]